MKSSLGLFCPLITVVAHALWAADLAAPERALMEKAIQAQGGEHNSAKQRTMRVKMEGMAAFLPGQPEAKFTIEDTWQMPDYYRSFQTFEANGVKHSQLTVSTGVKGWVQHDGQTQEMAKDDYAEFLEQKYAEDLTRLLFVKDKGFVLSVLGEIKIEGKPADGIRIKSKGHRDVELYFDTETGLLLKRTHPVIDPGTGKEVMQEIYFSDYQDHDGVMYPRKWRAYRAGKLVAEIKVIETEFFDKLDGTVFAKP